MGQKSSERFSPQWRQNMESARKRLPQCQQWMGFLGLRRCPAPRKKRSRRLLLPGKAFRGKMNFGKSSGKPANPGIILPESREKRLTACGCWLFSCRAARNPVSREKQRSRLLQSPREGPTGGHGAITFWGQKLKASPLCAQHSQEQWKQTHERHHKTALPTGELNP